jgi:hypothetical protein
MSKYSEIKFLVVFSLLSALFLQADAQDTTASPSRISIQLASPTDSIIAGRPFKIVVEMWNVDGLVPGVSCSTSVTVTDALDYGAKTVIPTTVFSGNPIPIPLGTPSGECFNNGLDTISVTLYNAPMILDSTDRITLTLANQSGTMLTISPQTHFVFFQGLLFHLNWSIQMASQFRGLIHYITQMGPLMFIPEVMTNMEIL